MTEERTGEAFEFDEQLTVLGAQLKPGDEAPDFQLDHFDGESMRAVKLSDTAGSIRLLNVVNSLDTPVCDNETREWERMRSLLPEAVVMYTVSMDLPFAQARWNKDAGLTVTALSSHRLEDFGKSYGVLIKEWRMLQRAVFVVDPGGRVVYAEYVADQMKEPDYDAAIEAAESVDAAATR